MKRCRPRSSFWILNPPRLNTSIVHYSIKPKASSIFRRRVTCSSSIRRPCESILIVEFYDDVAERLSILQSRKIGSAHAKFSLSQTQMNLVWSVRKAGLSLLTGCIGPAKPVAFIEDAAVRPAQLPEYVAGLRSIMQPLGLEACYYGHAASGLLHVRPVLDLHSATDLKKVSASRRSNLCTGEAIQRLAFRRARCRYRAHRIHAEQLGDELLGVMREIKRMFDPGNIFNPGKIFAAGRAGRSAHRIDNHLRENFTRPIGSPFRARLAFAFKDHSFIGNLEQCNGCGGCRKETRRRCAQPFWPPAKKSCPRAAAPTSSGRLWNCASADTIRCVPRNWTPH